MNSSINTVRDEDPEGYHKVTVYPPYYLYSPLLALGDLRDKGINVLAYADDGLLYGDVEADYGGLAQTALDQSGSGSSISWEKSS